MLLVNVATVTGHQPGSTQAGSFQASLQGGDR